jgi:hypothetical protein
LPGPLLPAGSCRPRLLGGGSCLPAGRVRDRELTIGDNDTPRRVGSCSLCAIPVRSSRLSPHGSASGAWFSERQTMCISQPTRTVHESAAPSRQGYRAARQHPSRYVIGTGLAPRRAVPPFGTPSRSSLAVHASPRIGHSAPGIWDLESLIEDLAHGQEGRVGAHPAGPLASGWRWRWLPRRAPGRSLLCEVPGQRTGAGDHPQRRRRREPPCRACTTRPRRPPIRTLLATPAPRAMVRN